MMIHRIILICKIIIVSGIAVLVVYGGMECYRAIPTKEDKQRWENTVKSFPADTVLTEDVIDITVYASISGLRGLYRLKISEKKRIETLLGAAPVNSASGERVSGPKYDNHYRIVINRKSGFYSFCFEKNPYIYHQPSIKTTYSENVGNLKILSDPQVYDFDTWGNDYLKSFPNDTLAGLITEYVDREVEKNPSKYEVVYRENKNTWDSWEKEERQRKRN